MMGEERGEDRHFSFQPSLFFACLFVLLELVLHFRGYGLAVKYLYNKLFFAALFGFLAGVLLSFLPVLLRRTGGIFLTVTAVLLYSAQLIYYSVFATYLSIAGTAGVTGQALDYKGVIWKAMKKEGAILLLFLLFLAAGVLYFTLFMKKRRPGWKGYLLRLAGLVLGTVLFLFFLILQGKGIDSPRDLQIRYTSVDLSVQRLGILDTTFLDLYTGIRVSGGGKNADTSFLAQEELSKPELPKLEKSSEIENLEKDLMAAGIRKEEESATEEAPEVVIYGPNILDLDLEKLAEEERSSAIKDIHMYVSVAAPTMQNEYTGLFSGYNLIFITAEGFDGRFMDPQMTPMLYQMVHEGFYFKNYYSPLWYGSTSGGEYANLTGLIPRSGGYLSMQRVGYRKNSMPFTLGNQLKDQGYHVYGFHNGEYTYYDRHLTHPVIGYENWIANGSGLPAEKRQNGTKYWPQSDAYMEKESFPMYSLYEPFHVYYMTISGHLPYSYGGNAMAMRHKDLVEELPYSEKTKVYIACQYEVELMLEELYQDLETRGALNRTLIVLAGDHVPYDDLEILDELAGESLDRTFDVYRNTLIIYSAAMEKGIEVDKICSSPDILPTVSNLMGLPYDSRMMAGQDILSDSPSFVVFQDHSIITDICRYNGVTGEVQETAGVEVTQDYIDSIRVIAANRIRLSDSICEYDYYSTLGLETEEP